MISMKSSVAVRFLLCCAKLTVMEEGGKDGKGGGKRSKSIVCGEEDGREETSVRAHHFSYSGSGQMGREKKLLSFS